MKRRELLFRLICLGATAALLVLTLLGAVELAVLNDRAAELSEQCRSLAEENRRLLAQCENSVSLEQIEDYAIRVLGMQHASPGQILYLDLP